MTCLAAGTRRGQIYLMGVGGIGLAAYGLWKLVLFWQGDPDEQVPGWQAAAMLIGIGIIILLAACFLLAKSKATNG